MAPDEWVEVILRHAMRDEERSSSLFGIEWRQQPQIEVEYDTYAADSTTATGAAAAAAAAAALASAVAERLEPYTQEEAMHMLRYVAQQELSHEELQLRGFSCDFFARWEQIRRERPLQVHVLGGSVTKGGSQARYSETRTLTSRVGETTRRSFLKHFSMLS